jgi:hypothetical protein
MKKHLVVFVLVTALALLATTTRTSAQTLGDFYLTATSTDCSTAGSCAAFDPGFMPSTTLTVSGTFSLTITFEATADGINWSTVQAVNVATGANSTTTTVAGTFSITNSGFLKLRARASAYTSGSAKVTATRGVASARLLTPTFTGTVTATSYQASSSGFYQWANGTTIKAALGDGAVTVENNGPTVVKTINGTLTTSTTGACTIADTNETNLWTYNLPAGALSADGRGLRITAWGTVAATANNKTIKIYFGASSGISFDAVAANGGSWRGILEVLRSSATSQAILNFGNVRSAGIDTQTITSITGSETMANAVSIRVVGLNGTAAANDVCFVAGYIETIK